MTVHNAIVISSGHGKKIRGASGYLDEVNEARKVTDRVGEILKAAGITVRTYHDDISDDQSENLNRIVDYHNSQKRDLDVSVHFNAHQTTTKPMGTEVLYLTQGTLADQVSAAIAIAGGFIDRGPKKRTDLYFLNNTAEPAILLEVCFVDSSTDTELYRKNFEDICLATAASISGVELTEPEFVPPPQEVVGGSPPPVPSTGAPARVDIVTSGNVIITLNGVQVSSA